MVAHLCHARFWDCWCVTAGGEHDEKKVTPRPCSWQPALVLPVPRGFPFPGAQPGSSEMMMLVHCGTMRILSQDCVRLRWTQRSATPCEQRQRRRAPARLQGTRRDTPVRLTENHRLNFFALLSKEKLPAPSPRRWDETVELWTSWCSFQQNPGGRKIKQNTFPR